MAVEGRRRVVLQLIESWGPGGAERVVVDLCRGLLGHGFLPIVGVLHEGWLSEELRRAGIETLVLESRRGLDLAFARSLAEIVRSRRVDVVHAHEFLMNIYGTVVGRLTGVPVVATVHGKNYFPEKLRRRVAYHWVGRQATLVAVSKDLRRFLARSVKLAEERVCVVPNGIEWQRYADAAPDVARLRQELAIPEGARIVGMVGNLYPVKGYPVLLRAAAEVIAAIPEAVFVIVGRGRMLAELEQMAEGLGIREKVKFLGFRPDVPEILKLLDVFALSSLSEGLSLSILEAMAAGRPVVATDVGGNPELVVDGATGYIVPPGDAGRLAERLIGLLRHREEAKRFGEAGLRRVEALFSREAMVSRYAELYAMRLSGREAPRACAAVASTR